MRCHVRVNPNDSLSLWFLPLPEFQQRETRNQLVQNKAGLIQRPPADDDDGCDVL